jgi:cation diffusion facilitator family transporter
MACAPTGSSIRVVLVALGGNLGVAAVKALAFAATGSSAMLTEAIHSLVDTVDQVLLLIGEKRGSRPPDETHPFGHGMEAYFWTFIVALLVFLLGGAVSIWQGWHKLLNPEPIDRPWINYIVLIASAGFESASFRAGYLECRRVIRGRDVRLWRFLRLSKDPNVFTVLLEDGAALVGLSIAGLGVTAAAYLGAPWADGLASILIGLLLVAVAAFLANETRSLMVGEAAPPPVIEAVREAISRDPRVDRLDDLLSLQLGPRSILFAAAPHFREGLSGEEVRSAAAELSQTVKKVDPRIGLVFLRPHDRLA